MRCKTCHYSLANREGLTEHRCPECGTPFDPNDPNTYAPDPQPRSKLQTAAWVVVGANVLLSVVFHAIWRNGRDVFPQLGLFASALAIVVVLRLLDKDRASP